MKTVLVGAASVVAALALAMVLFGQSSTTAEANVHGISASATTAGPGASLTLSIDADESATVGGDVTVVTTAGAFSAVTCTTNAVTTTSEACAVDSTDPNYTAGTADDTSEVIGTLGNQSSFILDDGIGHLVGDRSGGMDLVTATLVCPAVGPAAPVVSAIQNNTVSTINLICTGAVAEISLTPRLQWGTAGGGLAGCPAPALACGEIATTTTTLIESTTATTPTAAGISRAIAANLRTNAKDSAGNNLAGVTVIYITNEGTLVDKDDLTTSTGFATTAGAAGIANNVSLVHGTTGATGDVANITANAAGKTATADVTFAGDASSCDVTTADSSVGSGGSTAVTVNFWSNADKTVGVPDYNTIVGTGTATGDPNVAAVNAVGTGTFAVTGQTPPVGGTMTASLTVGASGGTGVLGTMGGTSVTCNTTVTVSTVVAPPTTGGGGDGTISGDLPASGFGLVTFGGGSVADLQTALATSCTSGAPIFATDAGAFVGFFPTTSLTAPNAAFNALFAGGIPAGTPLLGGNCG